MRFWRFLGFEGRAIGDARTTQTLRESMSLSEQPSPSTTRSSPAPQAAVIDETWLEPREVARAAQGGPNGVLGRAEIPERPDWLPPVKSREGAEGPWAFLWMSSADVVICGLLIAALLGVTGLRWVGAGRSGGEGVRVETVVQADLTYQIDVNRASWGEFTLLEGIGPSLARKIVEDREQYGAFRRVEDLDRVPGIGEKTLGRIRKHLRVGALGVEERPRRQGSWGAR